MRKSFLLMFTAIVSVFLFASCKCGNSLSVVTGKWAKYEFTDGKSPIPGMTSFVISILSPDKGSKGDTVWFQFEAMAGDKRMFGYTALVRDLDFLFTGNPDTDVFRYILFPQTGTPLEYVSANTGKALIPKIGFFKYLTPHSNKTEKIFFDTGTYLGHPVKLAEQGKGANLLPVKDAKALTINPDILIGTGLSVRDDGTKEKQFGNVWDWSNLKDVYNYIPLSQNDYKEMIDAGFSIFPVPNDHLPFVLEEPVYFVLRGSYENMPEILYRSNFFGAAMFIDEPTIRTMYNDYLLGSNKSPQNAAEIDEVVVRGRYELEVMRNLNKQLLSAGYDFGGMEILQPDFPTWETVPSSAWYEMESGVPGFVLEGRYVPKWFSGLIKEKLGVDFPSDAESCVKYHQAFFTGAARHFGFKWGVAIYGQMTEDAREIIFKDAYDKGATFFWFWTTDNAHHVLYKEQLAMARNLKEYAQNNPRKQSLQDMVSTAKTAIALPWGYLCDHYQWRTYGDYVKNYPDGRMWWSSEMELNDKNAKGVKYKDVMKAAVQEAANLLSEKKDFDFIFLKDGEKASGYDEVRRVLETGEVVVEK